MVNSIAVEKWTLCMWQIDTHAHVPSLLAPRRSTSLILINHHIHHFLVLQIHFRASSHRFNTTTLKSLYGQKGSKMLMLEGVAKLLAVSLTTAL